MLLWLPKKIKKLLYQPTINYQVDGGECFKGNISNYREKKALRVPGGGKTFPERTGENTWLKMSLN
jgi:hypothetical protein